VQCRTAALFVAVCTENDFVIEYMRKDIYMYLYVCVYIRELEIMEMRVFRHPQICSV